MRRLGLFVLMLLTAGLWQAPAQASGDFWCEPSWRPVHRAFSECDNMAVLAPGNDTRVNLLMLMNDQRKTAIPAGNPVDPLVDWPTFAAQFVPPPSEGTSDSDYADGEGSRCRSDANGATAFEAAVNATSAVPEDERNTLIAARKALAPSCTGPSGGAAGVTQAEQQVQSASGKSFAAYLKAAQSFYDGDYDAAKASFSSLTGDAQPWLSETARYMLGRVEVNRAQIDAFDEYGYPAVGKTVDPKVIDAAEAALQDYLTAYPQGQYAVSARGLLRRVDWLGGRNDKLAARYSTLLAEDATARGMTDFDFADEVDSKLLLKVAPDASTTPKDATTDPNLLAVFDLQAMRGDGGIDRAALEAQRASFAANPPLFDYLLAAYAFYVEQDPGAAKDIVTAAAAPQAYTNLEFSRQMLRGVALEALKDPSVRDHWLAMVPAATGTLQRGALELAIAYHDERSQGLERVFAADSPVKNPTLREILLENVADAALLRRQAADPAMPQSERDAALYTLLYKELSRGHYADFVKDVTLVPDKAPIEASYSETDGRLVQLPVGVFTRTDTLGDYDCGPLRQTAADLAKNPKAAKAQLCLADFFRANGFDQFWLDTQPDAEDLGGTPSLFGGKPYVRQAVYQALIAGGKASASDKAYALYRAVNCYAPSGSNSCGGEDVPISQRKAWFLKLKRDYPNSRWAKELQYYW